ncbi:MAG: choice-of-anchor J domain-containing protein [Chitinophagaceae bacterium]|nr:choice-of-anchor J domain-containing protein [Chitinophagaceae bacterium]
MRKIYTPSSSYVFSPRVLYSIPPVVVLLRSLNSNKFFTMQPKFTRKKLRFFCMNVIVLTMAFVLSAQISFSQEGRSQSKLLQKQQQELVRKSNDAGIPEVSSSRINPGVIVSKSGVAQRPEAVCASITGTLQAGDQTLPGNRPFRDGVLPTSCANKTCTPGVAGAGSFYDVINFANTQSTSQCVTLTYTVTAASGFTFLSVYQGSFDPANTCANYLSDCGSSPAVGTPVTFSFTLAGNATAAIVVSSVGVITSADYTLLVDGICAPCVPTNATAPVISSVPSSTCAGSPITLSIIGGSLNGAANWKWYTASCGGTLVGTGNSITVSPAATTTYYARGEDGCAPAAGPCAQQTVTVTSCTCLSPDVATICEGSIQRLSVTPTGATTSTFTSAGAVSIPSSGTATPYPSNIAVSGLPATGAGVYVSSVTLNGFSHTWPSDVDVMLQSPSGQNVIILSDAGGSTAVSNINMTFSDAAAAVAPGVLTSGTFRPTNVGTPDNFPAPGPGSLTQATPLLSSFTSANNPNGDWKLFVLDQAAGDLGTITSWSITFSVVPTAVWTASPAAPNSLFSNAAATIPYVAGTATDVVWVKPATTTTYTATISSGPCAGANNVTVTVLPRPAVTVSAGGCAPITLNAGGAVNYSWSPGGGLSSTTGASVVATPGANTTYTVLGYGANGCSNTASTTVNGTSTAAVIAAPPAFVSLINQGFDGTTIPAGWAEQNLSTPIGTVPGWIFGTATVLSPAQNGGANSYALGNFNNVAGNNTISNWLFAPTVTMQNGDVLTFYSRTVTGAAFPDRLEVRLSTNGASTNVGATNTSVGDFTTVLLTINPTLTTTGYPSTWTQFTATISGLAAPTSGRIAFRYFVTSGGPAGANSDNVGIDNVQLNRPLAGVCANTVSTFSVNITGGISPFTLVYSNGTTNTTYNNYTSGTPIQVSPSVTTNYTIVSVTGANGCAGVGNTGTATINVVAAPAITAQPQSVSACDAGNASFSVTATPLNNTYQWQVSTNGGGSYTNLANGGVYAGVTTTTLSLTGVTTAMNGYRYRVVITGQCPPSPVTSAAAILTVNVAPTITAQPANTTRCAGTTASFSVTATGNSPTYQWQVSTNGGGTYTNIAGATSATLTLSGVTTAMSGNLYRVVVTVAPCGTTATSNAGTLTVNALPVVTLTNADPSITPGQTTTITATSVPAAQTANSWSWTRNGSPVSPAVTGNVLTANIDGLGTYRATVTDVNGCTATSAGSVTITGEASDRLWIYPNPSSGQFQVRLFSSGNPTEKRIVSVYNSAGARIVDKVFVLTDANGPYLRMDFDLSGQAAGVYVVKVEDRFNDKTTTGLVVISH